MRADRRAPAHVRRYQPLDLQLLVGGDHRVAVHPESRRELACRGQPGSRYEEPRADETCNSILQLQIEWGCSISVEVYHHGFTSNVTVALRMGKDPLPTNIRTIQSIYRLKLG